MVWKKKKHIVIIYDPWLSGSNMPFFLAVDVNYVILASLPRPVDTKGLDEDKD